MSVVRTNQSFAFGEFGSTRQWKAFAFNERKPLRQPSFSLQGKRLPQTFSLPVKNAAF